jgi:hypothetical protein
MSYGPMTVREAAEQLTKLVEDGKGDLPMYTEYEFVNHMEARDKQPHDDGCLCQLDDGTPILYVNIDH